MTETPNEPVGSEDSLDMATFIQLSRIYDVLMLDMTIKNPSAAKTLLELHLNGAFMTPAPAYNGVFMTNEVNSEHPVEEDNVS